MDSQKSIRAVNHRFHIGADPRPTPASYGLVMRSEEDGKVISVTARTNPRDWDVIHVEAGQNLM
jgi:hypothetical protein